MKTIIAGSRLITDYAAVCKAIKESGFEITEVVSGTCRGVDLLGERWANENKIPIKQFPADWNKFGKSAGYKRNLEMGKYADALIAVWNGSKGTEHMINIANGMKHKVYVHRI
jgi:hypothetical protein